MTPGLATKGAESTGARRFLAKEEANEADFIREGFWASLVSSGVSTTLRMGDPLSFGQWPKFLKGHGDSRWLAQVNGDPFSM